MGAALLPLAIGGAGIAGGQYMKQQAAKSQQDQLAELARMGKFDGNGATSVNPILGRTSPQMANSPQERIGRMAQTNPMVAEILAKKNLETMMGGGGFSGTLSPGQTAFQGGRAVASIPAETKAPEFASGDYGEYQRLTQNGQFKGSYLQYQQAKSAATRQPESAMSGMTELDKLIAKRDTLPVGSPTRKIYEDAIAKATQTRDEGEGRDYTESKGLRSEFTTQAKPFQEVIRAYSRISSAGKGDPNGASDIALVYGYMKMLDPTSVVREGEFATAANAGGIPERVQNLYNAAIKGQKLPPEVRSQFLDISTRLYDDADSQLSQLENTYTDLAKRNNLRPENVVIDLRGGVKRNQSKAPPNLSNMSNDELMKALLGQQ